MQEQGQRSRFRGFRKAKQDSDDVQECYNHVGNLRLALQVRHLTRGGIQLMIRLYSRRKRCSECGASRKSDEW